MKLDLNLDLENYEEKDSYAEAKRIKGGVKRVNNQKRDIRIYTYLNKSEKEMLDKYLEENSIALTKLMRNLLFTKIKK